MIPDGQNGKAGKIGQKDRTVDDTERDEKDRLIRPQEAATLRGVSPRSLRRWASLGLLAAEKTPGGHRRYRESDVLNLSEPEQAVA